jgi:hypothetical protein
MNRDEFIAWEKRIKDRADRLWEAAGSPDGPRDIFMDEARELLAIEEVRTPTLDPEKAAEPVVEEAAIQGNLGEFPTLRDQGDEETYPTIHHPDDDEIHLSDGDASDSGGVLPDEATAEADLPDVSLADADVTTSALDADDDPPNDDLNDDGMPDVTDLDADADEEVEGEMPPRDEYEDSAPPDAEDDDVDLDDPDAEDDLNP